MRKFFGCIMIARVTVRRADGEGFQGCVETVRVGHSSLHATFFGRFGQQPRHRCQFVAEIAGAHARRG